MDKKEIRTVLNSFDQDMIKDAFASLLNEGGESRSTGGNPVASTVSEWDRINSFFELISYAKRKYDFRELDSFFIDNGAVSFEVRGRKHLISEVSESDVREQSSVVPSASVDPSGPGRFGKLEF